MDKIFIRMLDSFSVLQNGRVIEESISKSHKGLAFLQYLVLSDGRSVPTTQLLGDLWSGANVSNPESAMKTLVSRVRTQLCQISPELAACVVAERGSYRWQNRDGIVVDVMAVERLLEQLALNRKSLKDSRPLMNSLLPLYTGMFSQNDGIDLSDWAQSRAISLHSRYLEAVHRYVELLKKEELSEEISMVCRQALDADRFDEQLHIDLIDALIKSGRNHEAMNQYKTAADLSVRYLGITPGSEMQKLYKRISTAGRDVDASLEAMLHDLESDSGVSGAYVCEYVVFRDIYHLMMRTGERYGLKMVLAMVNASPVDDTPLSPLEQDNLMRKLIDALRLGLRKGDLITRWSPTGVALLMQMNDPANGAMVMERLKCKFYEQCPSTRFAFRYRVRVPGEEEK